MKRNSIFVVFTLMLFMLVACGGNESENVDAKNKDVIELSYAFFAPSNTFPAIQMEEWKKRLEKRTDGKVKVNLFHGGSLLDANNMYDGVASGTADIGLSSTSYEPGRFPLLSISDLPTGYKNATVASQVVSDLIEKYPPETMKDFKIITSFATEPAYIQSKDPIATLKDLDGKQLRIAGALTPIMEELGAAPVGMSQAEVPEALQTGIVDGYVSSREILKDSKLAEMVNYTTDYPLALNTFIAVMNRDKWESLPEDVQEVINDLNNEMTQFTGEYLDDHVKESIDWSMENHGLEIVELSDKEREQWDKKLNEMQSKYVEEVDDKGLPGSEYFTELKELVKKYNNQDK